MAITEVFRRGNHLQLRITGLEDAKKFTDPITTRAQIKASLEQGTEVAFQALRAATPVVSGKTLKGWRKYSPQGNRVIIENKEPSASFLFFGTHPHGIFPKNGKALSNIYGDSKYVELYGLYGPRKFASHPGTTADDKFVQAIDYQAGEAAQEVVSEMIQGFYANHGSLQRRTRIGRFGKRF